MLISLSFKNPRYERRRPQGGEAVDFCLWHEADMPCMSCSIKDWHPLVADCKESQEGGATFRTLTLKDGGTIKEKLTDKDDFSYSYEIVESPLPVKNYK